MEYTFFTFDLYKTLAFIVGLVLLAIVFVKLVSKLDAKVTKHYDKLAKDLYEMSYKNSSGDHYTEGYTRRRSLRSLPIRSTDKVNCQSFYAGRCLHQAAPQKWVGGTTCVELGSNNDPRLSSSCSLKWRGPGDQGHTLSIAPPPKHP